MTDTDNDNKQNGNRNSGNSESGTQGKKGRDNTFRRRRRNKHGGRNPGKMVKSTDNNISEDLKPLSKADVEEKNLGPGRKKRIFNRNKPKVSEDRGQIAENKSSSSNSGNGNSRSSNERPASKIKKKFASRTRRGHAQGKDDSPQKDNVNQRSQGRPGRSNRRGGSNRQNSDRKRDQNRPAKPDVSGYAPAKDAPDGIFNKDSYSSDSFLSHGQGRNAKMNEDISRGEVEWFSSARGTDFSTMKDDDIEFLSPHRVNETDFFDNMPVLNTKETPRGVLMDVVSVKTHRNGVVELYNCENDIFQIGEEVVVETARGMAIGEVKAPTTRCYVTEEKIPRVFRTASKNDMRQRDRNNRHVTDAFELCKKYISQLNLRMKLVEVVYMHGGNKAVFYFMAEGRVDFRVLVKELARELHIRVEMRQIGVRDASKMIGGIGPCGQVLCCSRYIKEFGTVSIKMAKDQDLVLNPEKVSGQCGRLMCCLAYENKVYKEKSKGLPKIGRIVMTPDGEGRVRDRDILRSFVRVQLEDQHEYKTFELKDIRPVNRNGHGEQKNNDE